MIKHIQNFFVQFSKPITIGLTVFLLFFGAANFYFVLEITPHPNDECLWVMKKDTTTKKPVFVFEQVKVNGVTWEAGIRDGDKLHNINGVRTTSATAANRAYAKRTDGIAVYTVSRNGKVFDTEVRIKPLIKFGTLGVVLLSFLWLLVSFFVVMGKREGETQKLFYRVGAAFIMYAGFALLENTNSVNPLYSIPLFLVALDFLLTPGSVFLPFFLMHFFMSFPVRMESLNKKSTFHVLYGIPWFLLALEIVSKFWVLIIDPQNYYQIISMVFFAINTFFLVIAAITSYVFLIKGYRSLEGKNKKAVSIILLAYTICILTLIYIIFIANVLAQNAYNDPQYFAPIILIAIVPVAFGYSVFKYSLMDISDIFKNAVIYGTATISLAGLYFLLIYLAGQSISSAVAPEYQGIIAVFVFILFAMIFQSTKDKFQNYLTKKFYPEQFAYRQVIYDFSGKVASIVGQENIINTIRETFVSSLKLNTFGVLLAGEEGKYNLSGVEGISADISQTVVETELLKEYIGTKRSLNQLPVIEQPDFGKFLPDFADILIRNNVFTVIPLVIKNNITGFLLFGLKYSGTHFAGQDLQLLVSAANHIGVALENARLYEAEAAKFRLESDLEHARKIQESLLPKIIPHFSGAEVSGVMIPAMQVGGDYYDFVPIEGQRLFIVNSDVAGKGLSASFYMSKLQTMIRLFCIDGKKPGEILSTINRNLFGVIEKSSFITASLCLFDFSRKQLFYCRAGHTPLLRISGGKAELLRGEGIGLGLEKGLIFEKSLQENEIALNSGDIFIMYSDGIEEAINHNYEFYGTERLIAKSAEVSGRSAEEIKMAILADVDVFRKGAPQNDDITLVVVKIL